MAHAIDDLLYIAEVLAEQLLLLRWIPRDLIPLSIAITPADSFSPALNVKGGNYFFTSASQYRGICGRCAVGDPRFWHEVEIEKLDELLFDLARRRPRLAETCYHQQAIHRLKSASILWCIEQRCYKGKKCGGLDCRTTLRIEEVKEELRVGQSTLRSHWKLRRTFM